jgi:hypothetical protein
VDIFADEPPIWTDKELNLWSDEQLQAQRDRQDRLEDQAEENSVPLGPEVQRQYDDRQQAWSMERLYDLQTIVEDQRQELEALRDQVYSLREDAAMRAQRDAQVGAAGTRATEGTAVAADQSDDAESSAAEPEAAPGASEDTGTQADADAVGEAPAQPEAAPGTDDDATATSPQSDEQEAPGTATDNGSPDTTETAPGTADTNDAGTPAQ